jgi:glyoxylase-like metal-dependent hydrolase (beta-lactamase superfamily II)
MQEGSWRGLQRDATQGDRPAAHLASATTTLVAMSDSIDSLTIPPVASDRVYFRQLLAGRDFAKNDPIARQMVNFVYAIGDRETGEAVLVDPAYAPNELVDVLEADDMTLTGALVTHYHPDHCGGDMMGHGIAGVRELLERVDVPVHVQADEVEWLRIVTEVPESQLRTHTSGDVVMVGDVAVRLIHTPGHTPGSQCFLVDGKLIAGDTLFLEGCGRTDLPGGDPAALYESLTQRLANVSDDTVLFPGHMYSAEPSAPMGETRQHNFVFAPRTATEWMGMFGR